MTLANLIAQQQQRLQQLKDDSLDIASILAGQVWDGFEVEVDEATEEGFAFDFAQSTQLSLSAALLGSYQDAFERDVLARFEALREELTATAGEETLSNARLDLASLRKGLKLSRHANTLIEEALDRAKPGVSRVIGTILGDLLRDPCQQMDALDNDMQQDAKQVRRELYKLREPITGLMVEETKQLITLGRQEYLKGLRELEKGVSNADILA